jgi:hypothetical protein
LRRPHSRKNSIALSAFTPVAIDMMSIHNVRSGWLIKEQNKGQSLLCLLNCNENVGTLNTSQSASFLFSSNKCGRGGSRRRMAALLASSAQPLGAIQTHHNHHRLLRHLARLHRCLHRVEVPGRL